MDLLDDNTVIYNDKIEDVTEEYFFDEMAEPVEQNQIPEPEQDSFLTEPQNEIDIKAIKELNKDAANVLAFLVTEATPAIAGTIAMAENTEKYRINTNGEKRLQSAFYNVFPSNKPIMPTWAVLLLVLVSVVAPILVRAFSDRAINKENKRLKAEIEKQNQRIAKLKRKRKQHQQQTGSHESNENNTDNRD